MTAREYVEKSRGALWRLTAFEREVWDAESAVERGRLIRGRRANLGLTIGEAADRAGVHYTTWSDLERGIESNPTMLTLMAVNLVLRERDA